ncbi:hypothetical protein QQ045_029932 [Rhodiola kirilowii]
MEKAVMALLGSRIFVDLSSGGRCCRRGLRDSRPLEPEPTGSLCLLLVRRERERDDDGPNHAGVLVLWLLSLFVLSLDDDMSAVIDAGLKELQKKDREEASIVLLRVKHSKFGGTEVSFGMTF